MQAHAALPEGVRARHPLLLVGGPPPAGLQPPLEDPAGAGRIRCLGGVPDADLPSLYRGAALFAFPSRYEGFGLPVLEAMACGVPVLCSTAPALVELTAGCAEHVPPEDGPGWQRALSALLGDLSRRQDLGRRGRSRAGAFTRERMTEQILQVLDEVTRCP